MAKTLFGMMEPSKVTMREEVDFWALMMLICALVALMTGFGKLFGFGVVGENITLNMRAKLYQAITRKNIGWFDDRSNAPGVLTSVLASEV